MLRSGMLDVGIVTCPLGFTPLSNTMSLPAADGLINGDDFSPFSVCFRADVSFARFPFFKLPFPDLLPPRLDLRSEVAPTPPDGGQTPGVEDPT